MLLVGFVLLLAVLVLWFLLSADIAPLLKFLLVLAEMYFVGQFLAARYRLDGEKGLILLKGKVGLDYIDGMAKHAKALNFLADVGLVVCYGALSLVLFRKQVDWKKFAVGIVLLTVVSGFVAPMIVPILLTSIKGVPVDKLVQGSSETASGEASAMAWVSVAVLYLGGYFGVIIYGLAAYAVTILSAVASTLLSSSQAIQNTEPGVTLLLPGGNIPLIEGILALIMILVVHESAHAALARVAKIPVLSSGIVLFGFIPIGAFIEPDEERLKKIEPVRQTRVLVAGSTSNFIFSFVFLLLLLVFSFATSGFKEEGFMAVKGFDPGTMIYSMDGKALDMSQNYTFRANQTVVFETSAGRIEKKADAGGAVGIMYVQVTKDTLMAKYSSPLLNFVWVVLGLSVALNFIIATVNLLPLPFFDGHRVLELNLKNKLLFNLLVWGCVAAFIVNFLPWVVR